MTKFKEILLISTTFIIIHILDLSSSFANNCPVNKDTRDASARSVVQMFEFNHGRETRIPIGLGVLLDQRHILTAAHVLDGLNDSERVLIRRLGITDRAGFEARLVADDDEMDIALLAVDEYGGTPGRLAYRSPLQGDRTIYVFGPAANDSRLTDPTVLEVKQYENEHLRFSATVPTGRPGRLRGGYSGSPIFNCDGNVVGIVTHDDKGLSIASVVPFLYDEADIDYGDVTLDHSLLRYFTREIDGIDRKLLGVDTRFSHFGSWRADVDTALDWSVKYENGEEFESTFTIIKIGYNKLSFQSHPKRKITVFICYIEEKELNELRKDMNIPRLNTTEWVPACDESDNATFKFGPIGVELQNSGKYWTRSGDIKIDHEDRIFKSGRELLRRHGIIAEFREFIVTIRSSFETRISLDNVSQSNIGVKKSRTIQYRALCDYSRSAREEEPHDCIDIDTVISEKN